MTEPRPAGRLTVERKRAKQMEDDRHKRSDELPKAVAEQLEEEEEFVAEIQDNKLAWLRKNVTSNLLHALNFRPSTSQSTKQHPCAPPPSPLLLRRHLLSKTQVSQTRRAETTKITGSVDA